MALRYLFVVIALWTAAPGIAAAVSDNVSRAEQRCAQQSTPDCHNAGVFYDSGLGVTADSTKAASYYAFSCKAGFMPSCLYLGDIHKREGRASDAMRLYDYACEEGSGAACLRSGVLRANGTGMPADAASAAAYYARGCDAGDAQSCYFLAAAYRYGRGVPVDNMHASRLYSDVCAAGEEDACYYLAYAQSYGIGTARDVSAAVNAFLTLCANGDAQSCRDAETLRRDYAGNSRLGLYISLRD